MRCLNDFMPRADVAAHYEVQIPASTTRVYDCLLDTDFNRSLIIGALLGARSLGWSFRDTRANRAPLTLRGLTRFGFVRLAEAAPHEIVLGLVAKPWTLGGGVIAVDASSFAVFQEPGYAKVTWSFAVREHGAATVLSTETRVHCTDPASLRRFRWYWVIAGPGSGLIRREMLRLVRACAVRPVS